MRELHARELAKPPKIADAHRGNGKRFVVSADEKLTAFMELKSAIRAVERPEPRNRQSTTHKAVRAFALARFAS
jgi:hypothetical protein